MLPVVKGKTARWEMALTNIVRVAGRRKREKPESPSLFSGSVARTGRFVEEFRGADTGRDERISLDCEGIVP